MNEINQKPNICIIHTGGTIGMKKTIDGYMPVSGHLEKLMNELPWLKAEDIPDYTINELNPLLDSSNMIPSDWVKIARIIEKEYDQYDGFLVLHGTDTMAYTASALSFMIENLDKPVIITGSQIPMEETRNDAQQNLLTSLMILGKYHKKFYEVFLYFDNQLFRGNRTTKVNAGGFDAFASPNFPVVGMVGVKIDIDLTHRKERKNLPDQKCAVVEIGESTTVASFRLFPGIKAQYLKNILKPPVQGVVLECFGAGNAPVKNKQLMDVLRAAADRGVVIVDITQSLVGTADLNLYATGKALLDIGVVSGYDMTNEAVLTKLFYLFEKGYNSKQVKKEIQNDLRGELTLPGDKTGEIFYE